MLQVRKRLLPLQPAPEGRKAEYNQQVEIREKEKRRPEKINLFYLEV